MPTAEQTDGELVAACLAGNREAFRRIVERYQAVVCSLAYSATGSITLSEDLAQETFVTAWKQLSELREYAKLRSWLCGIARFLIGKELRRQGREPLHGAGPLDGANEIATTETLPSDHLISQEEGAILWRSLERIPDTYREPLVLFYREEQSIARVAEALDLSEDAVKQRLSRGRKLLQEEMLMFVESALKKTSPGLAFTLGVMSALPLLAATSASATTVTVAATKTSATSKMAASAVAVGAILSGGAILLFSVLGFLIFMGGCFGYLMGRAGRQSNQQLDHLTRFWRAIALGCLVFVIPALAVGYWGPGPARLPSLYQALSFWMALLYALVFAALMVWLWRWKGGRYHKTQAAPTRSRRQHLTFWLGAALLVPTWLCLLLLHGMIFRGNLHSSIIQESDVQKIISEPQGATFRVEQRVDGSQVLWIRWPKDGKLVEGWTQASAARLALLAERGIAYTTRIEGRDFHVLGRAGRWLPLLSFFIVPMGTTLLLHRLHDRRGTTSSTRPDEGSERKTTVP